MGREFREGGCSGPPLISLICLSIVKLLCPDFTLFDEFLLFNVKLKDVIVITTCQESAFSCRIETPALSFEVICVNTLKILTADINSLNSSIVMPDYNLSVKNVDRWGTVILSQWNVSLETVFSIFHWENRYHVILACGYKGSILSRDRGDLACMTFENKTQISLLIPNVDTTIGSTCVANSILIERSTLELCLLEFLSKDSIFEKFLTSISWIPKLNRASCDSRKS